MDFEHEVDNEDECFDDWHEAHKVLQEWCREWLQVIREMKAPVDKDIPNIFD